MNTNTQRINTPLTKALCSAVFMVSSVAFLPNVALADSETVVVAASDGWESGNMETLVAHTGREVVHHLVAAKAALDDNQSGKARGNLVAAHRLNYSTLQLMPFLSITDDILNAKGKLALEEIDVFFDELLPIYTSVDALALYAPNEAKKTHSQLKNAEQSARKGDTKAAYKALDEAVLIISTTKVYMPVVYVEGQLKVALYGLNQPVRDTEMAKKAINKAIDSLQVFQEEDIVEPTS